MYRYDVRPKLPDGDPDPDPLRGSRGPQRGVRPHYALLRSGIHHRASTRGSVCVCVCVYVGVCVYVIVCVFVCECVYV